MHAEPLAYLNAANAGSLDAFIFPLTMDNSASFRTLLDSGSSDCFLNPNIIQKYNLPSKPLEFPVRLRLFDGSSPSVITHFSEFPVRFPCGTRIPVRFLLTPMDQDCSAVLGYRWLARHNPTIDWVQRRIEFRLQDQSSSSPVLSGNIPQELRNLPSASAAATSVSVSSSDTPSISISSMDPPFVDIRLVNAPAFHLLTKKKKSQSSIIYVRDLDSLESTARSSSAKPASESGHNIPPEYHEFLDVFSKQSANELPPHRPYDLKIELEEGKSPPCGPVYSLSEKEQTALLEYIQENLHKGFIRHSKSPYGAPVLFVKKADGSLRICMDYRGLNKITKKDKYPLPRISDHLDRLRSAKIFTKLDLRSGYNLVRIAPDDVPKTTFRTRYGSYETLVMPFGLTNAPAAFQRFMNDIFSDLLDVYVVCYLDDILIYSSNPKDHQNHVKEVLRRLRKHKLFCKPEKCEFHASSIEFLGFIVKPDGLVMDEKKVKVIQDWPEPTTVKEVQRFLGFANFYRRFIQSYSDIVIPLTRLTKKSQPWDFTLKCKAAFKQLKNAFTQAPVLGHYSPDFIPIIETDASDYAIAAILSMKTPDDEVHPIAFHSRTLNPTELNYDTHDKELLAIFEAFKIWRHYLEGSVHTIEVYTDHKNLQFFTSTKILSRRQARWSEYLSAFKMVVHFRPGKLGEKPDALTRRPDVYPKRGDKDYAQVNPQNCRPILTQEQLASSIRATFLEETVLRAASLMDFDSLRHDIIQATTSDPFAQDIKQKFLSSTPLSSDNSHRWILTQSGLLLYDKRIYVPDHNDLRLRILQDKHDHITAGHPGQTKTTELVSREFFWPGLRQFVQHYCQSCIDCGRNKPRRHRPYGKLKPLPIPERPWDSISMDLIEQLPKSSGYTAILVIVDRFTKQSVFIPTTDKITSDEVAQLFLLHVFSKHGIPSHVTSDRGTEFHSHFMRSLGTILNMKLHFTSGYHPEANGQVERTNQTLEQYLRLYCNYQQSNWSELLPLAEFAYNNATHSSTGVSPFFANKGYHPQVNISIEEDVASYRARNYAVDLNELHQELQKQLKRAQEQYTEQADRHRANPPNFSIGDPVYLRAEHIRTTRPAKKLSAKYLGPFEIIGKPGTHSYTLKLPLNLRGIHPVFHVSQLEPVTPNQIPNRVQDPPPPDIVDQDVEYEVTDVLDSKIDRRFKSCPLLFLVQWAGYEGTDEENSWISARDLANSQELVSGYFKKNPGRPGTFSQFQSLIQ